MFSLRNFLPGHSSSTQQVSITDLDWRDSARLGQAVGGSLLVLVGSAFRRSIFGLALTLGGGRLVYNTLRRPMAPVAEKTPRRERKARKPKSAADYAVRNGVPDNEGLKLTREITIAGSRKEIFDFVRNVENAPRYLKSVESVQVLDDIRSFWIGRTPFGDSVEWYMEVINEHPGEMIAWQSLAGSDFSHAGSFRLEEDPTGHGTRVRVTLEYSASEHVLGEVVAGVLGESPEQQLVEDLGRLKFQIEAGSQTLRVNNADPFIL